MDAWLRDPRRFVSALLVEVGGSAPLPLGATMLIDEYGTIEGSITGGCVESAVVEEAETALASGTPKLVSYGISDELAGTVGLMCGGVVHVFIHELSERAARTEHAALEAVRAGRTAALATVLDGPHAGAKLALVDEEVVGSLGGPELLDHNVARDAQGLIDEGRASLRRYGADGAELGSEVRVYIHAFAPIPQMLIFGAIDFSAALAPIARELGYAVTICDARERFASAARFSQAAEVVIGWPQAALVGRELGLRDAVLVFTHDPKFDEPALIGALSTDAGYIGALGSRRTAADRNRRLREAGVSDEQIARIYAPCGLDIGNRTPEETAIAVLAEIIAQRAGRPGISLRATDGSIHASDVATYDATSFEAALTSNDESEG
jgi:xanthine dehydrogenase accessory factor